MLPRPHDNAIVPKKSVIDVRPSLAQEKPSMARDMPSKSITPMRSMAPSESRDDFGLAKSPSLHRDGSSNGDLALGSMPSQLNLHRDRPPIAEEIDAIVDDYEDML